MDAEHANYYTREVCGIVAFWHWVAACTRQSALPAQVMIILIREFSTPDEEMKKIVLKALRIFRGRVVSSIFLPFFFPSSLADCSHLAGFDPSPAFGLLIFI